MPKKAKQTKSKKIKFPQYCDYSCEFADFGDPKSIGACRKELAVWCNHFEKYNNKNNKCFGTS